MAFESYLGISLYKLIVKKCLNSQVKMRLELVYIGSKNRKKRFLSSPETRMIHSHKKDLRGKFDWVEEVLDG